MPTAVLLVSDLDVGRFPSTCVRSGERTTTATHVWAVDSRRADAVVGVLGIVGVLALRLVGRRSTRVPMPVASGPYRFWRRRAMGWAAVTCFGADIGVLAIARGSTALVVLGVLVVVGSVASRKRAHSGFWVSCELRPAAGHVLVRRAHPAFDTEARALFDRSNRRR